MKHSVTCNLIRTSLTMNVSKSAGVFVFVLGLNFGISLCANAAERPRELYTSGQNTTLNTPNVSEIQSVSGQEVHAVTIELNHSMRQLEPYEQTQIPSDILNAAPNHETANQIPHDETQLRQLAEHKQWQHLLFYKNGRAEVISQIFILPHLNQRKTMRNLVLILAHTKNWLKRLSTLTIQIWSVSFPPVIIG